MHWHVEGALSSQPTKQTSHYPSSYCRYHRSLLRLTFFIVKHVTSVHDCFLSLLGVLGRGKPHARDGFLWNRLCPHLCVVRGCLQPSRAVQQLQTGPVGLFFISVLGTHLSAVCLIDCSDTDMSTQDSLPRRSVLFISQSHTAHETFVCPKLPK